jgi:glyoxylase-like metal-dependent hydrolase (beta-lactamase superfamily II)
MASLGGATLLETGLVRAAIARAQAVDNSAPLFTIKQVAKNAYCALARPQAFTNSNSAIFVNERDVLVVDAGSKPSAAAALVAQINREITPKPVRYLVDSHFHYDHTGGNPAFRQHGSDVKIIASEVTKQLMVEEARKNLQDNLDSIPATIDRVQKLAADATTPERRAVFESLVPQLKAYQAEMQSYPLELPDVTFDKTYLLKDRNHELRIEFHGRAHSAGDTIVYCPQTGALASGDAIISFGPNFQDGYPREWGGTIDSILTLRPRAIMPGHGGLQDGTSHAIMFRNLVEELTELVDAGKKAGKPVAELQQTITLASLRSLNTDGYLDWITKNLDQYAINYRDEHPLAPRLRINIKQVYDNIDRT